MITTEKPKLTFTKVSVLNGKQKAVYFLQGESITALQGILGKIEAPGEAPKKARRGRKPKAAQSVTAEAA